MARLKSDDKRAAILEAAIRTIAEQGLGAPTAVIAKRAGVAHGSVFTYFPTKAALLNAVFLRLEGELEDAVFGALPATGDMRQRLRHLWVRWTQRGVGNPDRRRALARLDVSDDITETSHLTAFERAAVGIDIVRRASATGALRDQPIAFVGSIVTALAGTTMDVMIRVPARAEAQPRGRLRHPLERPSMRVRSAQDVRLPCLRPCDLL